MAEEHHGTAKIAELIRGIRIATLTTVSENGRLRSRPMATQKAEFQGTLWFLTYDDSPKTNEIEREQQVNVSYSDPADQCYVSISGRARVTRDRQRIRELWSPIHKAWFPNGEDDPNIAVIEVNADEAEYWDSPNGAFVKIAGLAKAMATRKPYLPGENVRVDLTTGEEVDAKRATLDRIESKKKDEPAA